MKRKSAKSSTNTEFLTSRQACDILHCHFSTLSRWIKSGKLQAHKLSARKTLISLTAINTFLAESATTADSEKDDSTPATDYSFGS